MRTLTTKCEAEKKSAIEIMTATDSAAGMRLVSTGRADVDIDDLVLVDTLIAQQPKVLERAYSVIGDTMIGIAVKKGDNQLEQALLAGLKAVQDSGEQAAIFKKYGMATDLIVPAKLYTE